MTARAGAPARQDLGSEAVARVEAVVRDIGFPLEPERMYAGVLEGALALTGSDAGSLALLDDETHLLNIPMTQGFSDSTVRNLKIGVGEGVIGWVVANETPLIVPDTHAEPRFIAGDIDVRSEMAVPLFLGDRVIGALDVNAMRRDSYRGTDAAALLAFATQMAPRVQNARLYGETRQRADALHALFEIGKLVSETLDIDRLMERIVDALGMSARTFSRILKVARTIADLAGEDSILHHHLAEAIQYRLLDRHQRPASRASAV